MKQKKGQSALEFLTTYGWAFLVILIMIGALAYFGVLSPSQFLPDKCLFDTGFTCPEQVGNASGMSFTLLNGAGDVINVISATANITGASCGSAGQVNITQNSGSSWIPVPPSGETWVPNERLSFRADCLTGNFISGERPTADVTISYKKSGGTLTQTLKGQVSMEIN